MAGKITKKELTKPDLLQVEFKKLLAFIVEHQSKFYVILGGICFGLAIVFGWYLYRINYNKSAFNLYDHIDSSGLNDSKQVSTKILEDYKSVIAKYPQSKAALHSYYMMGNLYLTMNQIDLSIKAYDEFLKRASGNDYLMILAFIGKGYGYEVKNNFKESLKSFDNALNMDKTKIFSGQIYRDMGRIYEGIKDQKMSLEFYRKSLQKTTDPTMEMIIKRKIAELS